MKSPRDTEYEAIARISHRLRNTAERRFEQFVPFIEALNDNAKLWTTLASEVAQSDNSLPMDLRARIFWLGEFVTSETQKILRENGHGDIEILIEINAAILQGLKSVEAST